MKVCCVFSLESSHRGDSNEYTRYTILNINTKKIILNYPKSAALGPLQGTRERVRNSRSKRAIRVRVIEVLIQFNSLLRNTGRFFLRLSYLVHSNIEIDWAKTLGIVIIRNISGKEFIGMVTTKFKIVSSMIWSHLSFE